MIGPRKKISQILVALVDAVGNLEPRKRKTSKQRLLPSIVLKAGNQNKNVDCGMKMIFKPVLHST